MTEQHLDLHHMQIKSKERRRILRSRETTISSIVSIVVDLCPIASGQIRVVFLVSYDEEGLMSSFNRSSSLVVNIMSSTPSQKLCCE